jgi:predicted acetyltransferase
MSDPAYRPITETHREAYDRFLAYAFRASEGPRRAAEGDETEDEADDHTHVGERYGLFDGEDLVSTVNHIAFRTRLRGGWRTLAGVSAVSTPPEYRHRGYVRRLLAESLADYRERGWTVSALWPFSTPFYRKMGWATCNRLAEAEFPPGELSDVAARRDAGAEFVRLDPEDWERLHAVRMADVGDAHLTIDRTEEWWRERVFEAWGKTPHVYGVERGGELTGYLVYTVGEREDGDGKRLRVGDHAARDRAAWLDLLDFCYRHDSQVDRVRVTGPPAFALMDLADDPREVEYDVRPGAMVRLVDVAAALEAFDYPADGSLTLGVSDPLADWNEGTFELSVEDGTGSVRRLADDGDGTDPGIETDVGTLSQVVAGYHSAADAERYGDLTCAGDRERERLAALFPERDPYLAEGF